MIISKGVIIISIIEKKLILDVSRENTSIEVRAKQNDVNSRFLRIALKSGIRPITVDSDAVVTINAKRTDGQAKSFQGSVNDDGTVIVPITRWMMEKAETLICDVSVIDATSERKLTTMAFNLVIETATNSSDEITADDNYDVLVSLIADCIKAKKDLSSAAAAADEAANKANNAAIVANTAAQSAETAAERANASADRADHVNISATQTPTGADITVTNRNSEETTVHIDTLFAVNTWSGIRNAVRLGLASKLFPVGYEFTVHNSDYDYDMVWRVVAHDHHKAANDKLEHTMTLEMKNVLSNSSGDGISLQHDAPEALYYAESGLPAGTYNFTLDYSASAVTKGTYQFTLTKSVPAGGQIAMSADGESLALTACKISTYGSSEDVSAIENNIAITSGSSGTSLGTVSASLSNDKKLNCGQRTLNGSNNYAQSNIDRWLNSSDIAGSGWVPQTVFDRPSIHNNTYNGFMHGLPEDFLAAVQPAVVVCRTNLRFEISGIDNEEFEPNRTYEIERKFFLLSRPEIFGVYENPDVRDGEILEYYRGLTDAERIHFDMNNAARTTNLRSPFSDNATSIQTKLTSGSPSSSNPRNKSFAVAAACIIA